MSDKYSSNTKANSSAKGPVYKRLEDNGPKWGSNVKQNADGSFPYDSKMRKEKPEAWKSMIAERMAWARKPEVPDKIYTRKAPENYAQRTRF